MGLINNIKPLFYKQYHQLTLANSWFQVYDLFDLDLAMQSRAALVSIILHHWIIELAT